MHPRLIQLVSILLLIAQGWLGMAPGKVVCLPMGDCAEHSCAAVCLPHSHAPNADCDHRHGPVDASAHQHINDECPHLHVPGPDHPQTPNTGNTDVARRMMLLAIVPILVDWRPLPPPALCGAPSLAPVDSGITVGLKSTRLLI